MPRRLARVNDTGGSLLDYRSYGVPREKLDEWQDAAPSGVNTSRATDAVIAAATSMNRGVDARRVQNGSWFDPTPARLGTFKPVGPALRVSDGGLGEHLSGFVRVDARGALDTERRVLASAPGSTPDDPFPAIARGANPFEERETMTMGTAGTAFASPNMSKKGTRRERRRRLRSTSASWGDDDHPVGAVRVPEERVPAAPSAVPSAAPIVIPRSRNSIVGAILDIASGSNVVEACSRDGRAPYIAVAFLFLVLIVVGGVLLVRR